MVPDFEWLAQNTDLTLEQITFLKNYQKPFTILTDAMPIRVWINYVNEEDG
jgi:hypothetical protein